MKEDVRGLSNIGELGAVYISSKRLGFHVRSCEPRSKSASAACQDAKRT